VLTQNHLGLMTIRRAQPHDSARLADLAALDSARPLTGTALVGEVEGEPVAALELDSGRAVADPFRPTRWVVDLLRLRAAQLR
jgi:hypothetical protein